MKYLSFLLLVLLWTGCSLFEDSNDPRIFIEVDKAVYSSDESAVIFLSNFSGRTLTYNLCHALIESFHQGIWVSGEREGRTCTDIGYTLKSNRVASAARPLNGLAPGIYRFTYEMIEGDYSDEKRYSRTEQLVIFTSNFELR